MKKFALKGLGVIVVAVALCMFFAGTVRTMTTPKIKLVTPKQGKLEQTVELTGKLTFDKTAEMRIDEARGYTLLVDQVLVRPGYQVKKGDLLFTMTMTDYEEKYDKLKETYEENSKKLDDLDIKNRKLNRTNQRNDAYEAMLDAHEGLVDSKVALRVLEGQEGLKVLDSGKKTSELVSYVKQMGGTPALQAVTKAYADARTRATRAENNLYDLLENKKTKGKDGIWEYLKERQTFVDLLAETEKEMAALTTARTRLAQVTADTDGYVATVAVKAGEAYEGKAAALTISTMDQAPVLRADLSEVRKNIQTGATVSIKGNYESVETQVVKVGVDLEGKKYCDVALTPELIELKGGVYAMSLSDTDMTVTFRDSKSSTLVPASAVRSEGENDRYVFVVSTEYGSFTGQRMKVTKREVTVLSEAGSVVSVAEDLSNMQLADKEDRAIKDGDTVMEYLT